MQISLGAVAAALGAGYLIRRARRRRVPQPVVVPEGCYTLSELQEFAFSELGPNPWREVVRLHLADCQRCKTIVGGIIGGLTN